MKELLMEKGKERMRLVYEDGQGNNENTMAKGKGKGEVK